MLLSGALAATTWNDFILSTGFNFHKALKHRSRFSENRFFGSALTKSSTMGVWAGRSNWAAGRGRLAAWDSESGTSFFPNQKGCPNSLRARTTFSVMLRVLQAALASWQSCWTAKSAAASLQPRGRLTGYIQVIGVVWDRHSSKGRGDGRDSDFL